MKPLLDRLQASASSTLLTILVTLLLGVSIGVLISQLLTIVTDRPIIVQTPDIYNVVRETVAELAWELEAADKEWQIQHDLLLDELARASHRLSELGDQELAQELNRRWNLEGEVEVQACE